MKCCALGKEGKATWRMDLSCHFYAIVCPLRSTSDHIDIEILLESVPKSIVDGKQNSNNHTPHANDRLKMSAEERGVFRNEV